MLSNQQSISLGIVDVGLENHRSSSSAEVEVLFK